MPKMEEKTGCELLKCSYYIEGICTHKTDCVDINTGEDCCPRNDYAVLRKDYILINRMEEICQK